MPSDEWDEKARELLDAHYAVPTEPPTIAELEKILQSEDDRPLQILPDGSISAEPHPLIEKIATFGREAYQRGRNEADTAAERRGIERAAKIADEYADWTYWGQYANASAAEAAAAEIAKAIRLGRWLTPDEISTLDHIGKAPLEGKAAKEYQRGYADALRALAPPMADTGPTEPAGASDKGALRS